MPLSAEYLRGRFGSWVAVMIVLVASAIGAASQPRIASGADVRETPLSPEDEQATFRLADTHLAIELVASEPELNSPVAISWDADGRMYVAEMIDYPTGPTAGQIRLLEDRDGDGRYEHATVFASGLRFPNGVLASNGGVLVTAAPDLLFLKDTNGDGKADEQRVLFTGFAEGNQQLRANGLTWGLDNWIYGANGRSDGNVRRPNEPEDKAVSIRARDFRFRPRGERFEATSGQSQFGQTSDDWGNRFLGWNTIPIRQAIFDQDFLDRNPRLGALGVRDIAEANETGQVFPISPRPQTFNRERTDYYNALCGLSIFRGDGLGKEYLGSAFVGESLTSLVHRRLLTEEGPTIVSRRGEHGREFLASTDSWFHPVYTTTGPDGALYIVDFYRRWVEHPAFVAESLRGGVDWRKGAGHGRIWRVIRKDLSWPLREPPRLSRAANAELAAQLGSPNGWCRDTAQRLLVERNDPHAAPLVRTLLADTRLPQAKLHSLATLDALGQLDEGTLLRAMEDGEPHVRQFAMRLAAPRLANSQPLRAGLVAMADFPYPLVRFQAALALGNVEGPEKAAALVKLASLENRDPLVAAAIVGSLGKTAGPFLTQLLKKDQDWRYRPTAPQMKLLNQAAACACARDEAMIASCLELIAPARQQAVGPGDLAILGGAAQGATDRGKSLRAMLREPPAWLAPHVASLTTLLAAARTMAAADNESLEHRLAALEVLGQVDPSSGSTLLALLEPNHDQALQSAAATALAQADAETARAMFERWPSLTTATRRALFSAALRSANATTALVAAIESGQITSKEIEPSVRDALLAVRDSALRMRIERLFKGDPASADRGQVVARFEAATRNDGDRAHGAALFEKHCLVCHTVQGRGQRVGPDLSGVGARPKETLLIDLFDPNRQVNGEFVSYTLLTTEGQVLTGLVVSETTGSVTLRRAEGAQDVVLRSQVEQLRATGKSLMPEGFEQSLSEADVSDLFTFLARPDAALFSRPK